MIIITISLIGLDKLIFPAVDVTAVGFEGGPNRRITTTRA